jgi:hypothetical protein
MTVQLGSFRLQEQEQEQQLGERRERTRTGRGRLRVACGSGRMRGRVVGNEGRPPFARHLAGAPAAPSWRRSARPFVGAGAALLLALALAPARHRHRLQFRLSQRGGAG